MDTSDLRALLDKTAKDHPTNQMLASGAVMDPLSQAPGAKDAPPPTNQADVNVDEDRLGRYLISQLKNDIADKEQLDWEEKREYDLRAYYGLKQEWLSYWPWMNSSNYPVPITPVLMDTGWAAIDDIVWRNRSKVITVAGIGPEDVKNAGNLETVLNWQVLNDIEDCKRECSANTHQMLLHGTSYLKVIRTDENGFKLAISYIPIERIFLPIDAKGPSIKDSDHITQIVPLTANDLRQRVAWGVYNNLNQVGKGWNVGGSTTPDKLAQIRKQIMGLDVTTKMNRDTWYIAETYITYYPENSVKSMELVVWWAPSTGKILRKVLNTENLRPFSDWYIYPNHGMAFHQSMPEKIRHVQEKADYTDKQITDSADKANSPAGFYDGTMGFDPNMSMRAPTGMYPVKNIGAIQWEPVNVAPIMERQQHLKELWLQAERITGFTDLYQGINSGVTDTLGQDQMRAQRTDLRFSKIGGYINDAWKRTIDLNYQYDDRYMPRDVKIRVLGSKEFKTIDEIFKGNGQPIQGQTGLQLNGRYDFAIANKTISDDQRDKQIQSIFADQILADPIFGQDVGNRYRCYELKAEVAQIKDLGEIIRRPKDADIITPDEVIYRIMNGEKNLFPSVYANPADYEERLKIYMRNGNFTEAPRDIQFEFERFLKLVIAIRIGREQAFQRFAQMQGMMNGGMPPGPSGDQQGGPAPSPSGPGNFPIQTGVNNGPATG